jgi:hypothetical protein
LNLSRTEGVRLSDDAPKAKVQITEILQIAQNALSTSPLLLLVGKSSVKGFINKKTLISVSTFSSPLISSAQFLGWYAASLGTKPEALLTVELLISQCVCRVAQDGSYAGNMRI